ncbi:centrosomal protein of 44 kDa [Scomber japonicus]|uniref:centrosomal protein of 44 kDa n=1 Tax=Scomber japonicus TaxID=13676 RepID=UPI0023059DF1|nr:centrosomal protein of 44 kDa [Scomber japonicus]
MLSTGDVQGCLRKLETLLRVIKYPGHVDYSGLSKGDPSAFLPIVGFTLTSFSPPFAEQLVEAGLELTGKTDLRFTDTLYKVLRDIFHYKPILSKQQFLQWGFSQRKISVVCDIINLVLQRHNQMKKVKILLMPRLRYHASHKDVRGQACPTLPDADTSPEVEGRLSALEAQLGSIQFGLDRLSIVEKRLEEHDRRSNKDENEVITISKRNWENLMSRVLLLETKLELSNTQSSVPPPCQSSTLSCSSSSMCDASKEDMSVRLERITNMLKSTSSLLKNTESTATQSK